MESALSADHQQEQESHWPGMGSNLQKDMHPTRKVAARVQAEQSGVNIIVLEYVPSNCSTPPGSSPQPFVSTSTPSQGSPEASASLVEVFREMRSQLKG